MKNGINVRQTGAALIVGLILTTVASIVTLSSMRGSHLQENMTSNLYLQATAHMAAEAGASAFWNWITNENEFDPETDWASDGWQGVVPIGAAGGPNAGNMGRYFVDDLASVVWTANDVEITVRGAALGPTGDLLAQSLILSRFGRPSGGDDTPSGGPGPFSSAIIGCEGVTTRGSGRIDSYDSRVAAYDPSNPGNQAHVQTTEAGATVELLGNAPIYGNVNSTGNVSATGSSPVHGNVHASGDVQLQGGGVHVYGDVHAGGSVNFNSSATVHGDISANGDVHFGNWGAQAHGSVQAGGNITSSNASKPPGQHVGGGLLAQQSPGFAGVPNQSCDPLDVQTEAAQLAGLASSGPLTIGSWPTVDWVISPDEVRKFDRTWNVNDWVTDTDRPMQNATVLGEPAKMLKVNSLNLTASGQLTISGGDVVLFVDGDFSIGGNTKIQVDPGSSLTVVVTGRFDLAGSVVVNNNHPVDANGKLPFSLYSSYEQTTAAGTLDGIRIRGNTDLAGVVYAPLSHVSVSGSGDLFGQVRGKTVEVSGAGGVHYDVALADVGSGGGPGGPTPGGPPQGFGILDWRMVLPLEN